MTAGRNPIALLLGVFAVALTSCDTPTGVTSRTPLTLSVSPDSAVIEVGEGVRLAAQLRDSMGNVVQADIRWSSSAPGVARVDSTGLVHGAAPGSAFVVARFAEQRDSAAVRVTITFSSVHAGTEATCGLTTRGVAYCWGWNQFGAVGNGSSLDAPRPSRVSRNLVFTALDAGGGVACGLASGVDPYCWGYNGVGQLGDGTRLSRNVPVPVSGNLSFGSIDVGAGTTPCGVTASGALYCWGWNAHGQLQDGNRVSRTRPVPMSPGPTLGSVTGGAGHMCGLDLGGAAYCWGRNDLGQLGDYTAGADREAAGPVASGPVFRLLATGIDHTCGLTPTGEPYCWGGNTFGEVGSDTGSALLAPTLVPVGVALDTITTTGRHTCGLTSGGIALCWGANGHGQLGNGSTPVAQAAPVVVSGELAFRAISAGTNHTCGITRDGLAYCWGRNVHGGLGNGTRSSSSTPVRVAYQR